MTEARDDGTTSESRSSKPVAEVVPTRAQVEDAVAADSKRSRKVLIAILATILVAILATILVVGGFAPFRHQRSGNDISKIRGKVALSAQELRDIVVAQHITAYWAGPQDGAKYALIASSPGVAFVRYLPGGVGLYDTKSLFRAIGTYTQKNAFAVSSAGALVVGNAGFVNADGNAIFYSKARPTNVYVGIKGKDVQLEVFDPVVDQALGLVLVKNQVRQIN